MQLGVLGLVIVLFLESATPLEQTKKEQYKEHTGSASVVQVQINPNIHHTQEEKATFSPEQYFQRKDDVAAKQYHQVETENQGNRKGTSESAPRPQSTVFLDTEEGSRSGHVVSFNLTEAVQIGIRFQDLFCPKFCDGNGNVKSQECSRTTPSCPTCLCEADCGRYGYCCSHLQPSSGLTPSDKEETKHKTNVSCEEHAGSEHKRDMNSLRSQNTEGHAVVSNVSNCMEAEKSYFRCFAIEKWKTVYLVAKCPPNQKSSDEFHNNNTVIPITRNGHAANKLIIELCDSCISNVDLVSLVTSHLTGDTYCNKYCLQCHENRSLERNDLTWQQEETCRAVPAMTQHGIEVTTESLKSCLEEDGHSNQSASTDSRNCSNGQSQLMSKEKNFENQTIEREGNFATQENTKAADTLKKSKHKIRLDTQCSVKYLAPPSVHLQACDYRLKDAAVETCNLTATRQVFQDAANETVQDLERLCVDHWAPVYDKTMVYRNIFCFICQGQKPIKCGEFRQNFKPETKSMFKEITIALLTDLSGRVESRGSSGQDQDNSTFSCKDGFWENPITGRCLKIKCLSGRTLSIDQSRCVVAEPKDYILNNENGNKEKAMNINKRKEQNVFVLHLLWRKRFGGSFQTPSVGKLVVEEVDKIKSKTMDRVEYRDAEYVALPANFNKRKKEGFNRLRAKNPTQIDFFLGPDIKFDRDEVLFDIKTNSNDVNKPLIRFMKEYETHIKQTNVAKQTGSLSSKLEMSKCLVPCQNLRGLDCFEYVKLYPDTCERSGLDAGECWLRILREALHCLKLTACDLGGCDLSTKYGNTDMFTTPNITRRKQKHLEYGQEKLQTLLSDVHEYIASVMKQLDITNYLLLKYISKLHTPEQYDLSKFSDHIDEMRSVLYLQTSTTQNRTVLEEKLTRQFHGEYFIEKSASPLLVMMLSSTPVLRFADFSLSITKSQWVTGSNVNCQIGSPTLDALTSFYQQVCGPSPQRFNSNNIIGVDLTSTCPFVSFNASDFNVSDTGDNSISLISEEGPSLTVPRFNYTMDGERVHICLKTLNILMKKERIPLQHSLLAQMENILTIISLCLSLASLLALFVTYSVFPTLRSLPGKNNMILVFWIFVAQLQLCLEPFWRPYHKTCMMMGILLHVSWLYTIVWTTVCSFHMCRIFAAWRGVALKHSTSHRFYLIRYLVGSSTFSFCLVAAVIVGSGASSGWTEIGYGGRGVCYLSSTLLVLLAFALPLALTLAINSALFGLTVLSISRVDAIQRQAGRERRNAHVYLRLSSLTGLCWTLALLAEIPGLSPLRCVSVVVNGCQGLFLFLSYACNRRVYRLWTNVLSTKAGRSPGMERGAQLRSHKLTRIERSSSRRTGSTVVAGLV